MNDKVSLAGPSSA